MCSTVVVDVVQTQELHSLFATAHTRDGALRVVLECADAILAKTRLAVFEVALRAPGAPQQLVARGAQYGACDVVALSRPAGQ
jgi:hypothetical protein